MYLFGGQEAILLESEGQVFGDRDQIPIQQLGGFVLTDGAVAHRELQEGVCHRIDRWRGTVPELSYDEFSGLFHGITSSLDVGPAVEVRYSNLRSSPWRSADIDGPNTCSTPRKR